MKAKNDERNAEPREGEVYKTVVTFGRTFELRYGYYDDIDRNHPPDIIYPDLIRFPVYTDSGEPFVTMMQDACRRFHGSVGRTSDTTCADCDHFVRGDEWFGICGNINNKKIN